MAKYLYLLAMEKDPTEIEAAAMRRGLLTLFETEDVTVSGKREFRIGSSKDPDAAEQALRTFRAKFGRADFRGGGKVE